MSQTSLESVVAERYSYLVHQQPGFGQIRSLSSAIRSCRRKPSHSRTTTTTTANTTALQSTKTRRLSVNSADGTVTVDKEFSSKRHSTNKTVDTDVLRRWLSSRHAYLVPDFLRLRFLLIIELTGNTLNIVSRWLPRNIALVAHIDMRENVRPVAYP